MVPLLDKFGAERERNTGRGDDGWLVSPRSGRRVVVRTRYPDLVERWSLEVTVSEDGRLVRAADLAPLRTGGMYAGLRGWDVGRPVGRAVYAVDGFGQLYAGDPTAMSPDVPRWLTGDGHLRSVKLWHHSSFVCGAPVICAGDLETDDDGRVVAISNWSGHYQPGRRDLAAALLTLQDQGADLSGALAELVCDVRGKPVLRAWSALDFLAAKGEVDGLFERTFENRRRMAMKAAERFVGRRFDAGLLGDLDRRLGEALAIGAEDGPDAFDADDQVHWNWVARWCLEEAAS